MQRYYDPAQLVFLPELADRFGVSESTARRWMAKNGFPAQRAVHPGTNGQRALCWLPETADAAMAERTAQRCVPVTVGNN